MSEDQQQSDDKIKKLQGQVQDVTNVMEKNIELGKLIFGLCSDCFRARLQRDNLVF